MVIPKVSKLTSLQDVLKHPSCAEMITEAVKKHRGGMSAEEFLDNFTVGFLPAAAVGKQIAQKSSLKSVTAGKTRCTTNYGYVCLGLLCCLVEQGLLPNKISEAVKARECLIVADVPSSPLTWNGEFSARIIGQPMNYNVEATVTFRGQMFSWGRGKRIIAKVFADLASYVSRFETDRL